MVSPSLQSFVIVTTVALTVYAVFIFFPSTSTILPLELSRQLLGERCTDQWVLKNLTTLKQSLEANVFGQHVASRLM
jgi:hypothetical protein